ncbi:hypothetical protein Efla_003846 [Eimeria flavescens]
MGKQQPAFNQPHGSAQHQQQQQQQRRGGAAAARGIDVLAAQGGLGIQRLSVFHSSSIFFLALRAEVGVALAADAPRLGVQGHHDCGLACV